MVDVKRLRGIIAEQEMSQAKVAKELGITPKTFYLKMKKGVFDSEEMSKLISVLGISDPAGIFFADFGT